MTDFAFTTDERTDLRAAQEAHMMDRCQIVAPTVTQDAAGQPVGSLSWTGAAEVACGFFPGGGKLEDRAGASPVVFDAVLRLPSGTAHDCGHAVRITRRYGETVAAPLVYEVVREGAQGPSGLVVLLKLVEP